MHTRDHIASHVCSRMGYSLLSISRFSVCTFTYIEGVVGVKFLALHVCSSADVTVMASSNFLSRHTVTAGPLKYPFYAVVCDVILLAIAISLTISETFFL